MSDSTYKKVKEYLVQREYTAVPDETYDHIDEWLEWYQNDVEKFHHYKLYNGAVMTNQERYKLGMAKTVCEDWANLLLNEKVAIKAGKYSERLAEILNYNNFRVQGNRLIENRQKHCIVIADVIINMVRAVSFLDTGGAIDATVDFDDSIIEDSNSLIDKNVKLVNAGLRSKLTAIMEINKCSEQEAQEELERIRQDNQITGQDIDWTGGDDDELDEEDDSPEEKEGEENQDPDDSKSGKAPDPGDKE